MNYRFFINKFIRSLKNDGANATIKKIVHRYYTYKKLNKKPEFIWKSKGLKSELDISVIIPTYNRSDLLDELITRWEAIQQYTKLKFEVIISDDGSADNTLEILSKSNKINRFVVLKNEHKGPANARNQAIMHAKGHIVLIVGDDIYPDKDFLDLHFNKHKSLSDTDALLGNCIWYENLKSNFLMKHITELGCEQFSFVHFNPQDYIDFRHFYTCNISLKREFLLSEDKLFDERFYKVNFEDVELGYRLSKKGLKIFYDNNIVAKHNHLYNSVEKFFNRQKTAGEMANVLYKIHPECDWFLSTETIKILWSNYILSNIIENENPLLDKTIELMQTLEDKDVLLGSKFEESAKIIYQTIFRIGYEKGVNFNVKRINVDNILANRFLSNNVIYHIEILCNIYNLKNLYEDINNEINKYKSSIKKLNVICTKELETKYANELDGFLKYINFCDSDEFISGYIFYPENNFVLSASVAKSIIVYINSGNLNKSILMSYGLNEQFEIGVAQSINNSLVKYVSDEKIRSNEYVKLSFHSQDSTDKILDKDINNLRVIDNYKLKPANLLGRELTIALNDSRPVIFIFPTFLAVGGAETNLLQVMEELKSKYRFIIITTERLNTQLGSLHSKFINCCEFIYDLAELYNYSDYPVILNYLKSIYKPNCLLITNGSPWLAQNISTIRTLFHNEPIIDHQVYDVNNGWVSLYYEYKKSHITCFDRFIAINKKIERLFLDEPKIDANKIDMIYHVVDTERFSDKTYDNSLVLDKFNLPKDKLIVSFVGRMSEQKRPELLLRLIKIVNDSNLNLHFVIVGNGPLNDLVDRKIKELNITNITRIIYLSEVEELYSISDVFIMTSEYEGLPIAMLEAMCKAVPVFAPNVGDIDVIVGEYNNGFVFNKDDNLELIAQQFESFVNQLNFYKNNSLVASHDIRNRFSRKRVAQKYNKSFELAMVDLIND